MFLLWPFLAFSPFVFLQVLACDSLTCPNDSDFDYSSIPFMVSIERYNMHICAGFILNERFILTVAQCVYNYQRMPPFMKNLKARAGSQQTLAEGDLYIIKKVTVHPQYFRRSAGVKYNIALLEVNTPIEFNDNVRAIPLASCIPANGNPAAFIGYQDDADGSIIQQTRSAWLTHTYTNVVDNYNCGALVRNLSYDVICSSSEDEFSNPRGIGGVLIVFNKVVGLLTGVQMVDKMVVPQYTNAVMHKSWVDGVIGNSSNAVVELPPIGKL